METDPTRMCELLVGLPDVEVLGVADRPEGPLVVWVQTHLDGPRGCGGCGGRARVKDRDRVALVDLPVFGRPARLVWNKRRFMCVDPDCGVGSFTEQDPRVAPARAAMTDRAGRWATAQVGRSGRTVNEVAVELGCDWHTVNDAVMAYGAALLAADLDRVGHVEALGLDETLFVRRGRWRTQTWCTSIVDVKAGQLLEVVEDRTAAAASTWIDARPESWRSGIR